MVTRAAAQAGGLCGMLESRGATPIAAPMVHVERLPPTDALREVVLHLGSYDWIIFTSVNGVDSFFDAVGEIAGTREAALAGPGGRPMIAAVGPSTADALTRRGAAARFVPAVHSAAALAAGLGADAASGIAGARILFPRAETAREEAVTILHQRGAFVEDIPFYRTKSAEISETDLAAIRGGVDAILFMSGSAVHAFCDRTETEPVLAAAARHALVACLGPSTADAARERGLTVSVMPEEHTAGALVESLERHFSRGNGGPS